MHFPKQVEKKHHNNEMMQLCESHHREVNTMFPSGDVYVLAESGMGDVLQDLEAPQDFNGVRSERKTIAATDIMRKSWRKEGEGPQLGIFEGSHGARVSKMEMIKGNVNQVQQLKKMRSSDTKQLINTSLMLLNAELRSNFKTVAVRALFQLQNKHFSCCLWTFSYSFFYAADNVKCNYLEDKMLYGQEINATFNQFFT